MLTSSSSKRLYFYDKVIHHEKFKNLVIQEYTIVIKRFHNESSTKLMSQFMPTYVEDYWPNLSRGKLNIEEYYYLSHYYEVSKEI